MFIIKGIDVADDADEIVRWTSQQCEGPSLRKAWNVEGMWKGANEDRLYAPGACQLDLVVTKPGITAHTHIISVHAESGS